MQREPCLELHIPHDAALNKIKQPQFNCFKRPQTKGMPMPSFVLLFHS